MARVTLKMVAAEIGMSAQTVSDVVNRGGERYSEATRRRVLAAARRLGYQPNRQARVLRGVRSGQVGLVHVGDFVEASAERNYYLHQEICATGYEVLAYHVFGDKQTITHAVASMIESRVEGVVFANLSVVQESDLQSLKAADIPFIIVGSIGPHGVNSVLADHRHAARLLVEHLIALGHRKLCMFSYEPGGARTVNERILGFQETVKLHAKKGVTADLVAIKYSHVDKEYDSEWIRKNYYEPGARCMQRLLELDKWPDALICSNDYHGIAAIHVCNANGIRIPEDIALVGFDATGFSSYTQPPLTTVAQPNQEIARYAVQSVIAAIKGQPKPDRTLVLPCKLLVRESCGAGLIGNTVRQKRTAR